MVTALYRRYRPETFAEMIGQSQVTDPLMTALRADRVNHAYLFSGPRGCGKTTSARILARCLNCVEGPTDVPCGKCSSCLELGRDGSGSLDVVEIDAASHNGVDDARDIRERAVFAPARDRYKIFILDEAHMVTPQGFNALLKIVEEPPEHVKFIFATTEPEKVIGTIRSRTHHYPFRLVPPGPMLDYVQALCDTEGVTVAPGVLPLVVRAGGGSPRDTLSLLDQLMAGSENDSVDYERAVALLGYTHSALLDEVIDALAARDAASAFGSVDRVIQTGQDPRRFVEDLLERLRDLIVVQATTREGAAAVLRGIPSDELDRMVTQSGRFGPADLSRIADIVNSALTEMTGATSPRLHLELMIARTLVPSADDSSRGALVRVERLERRVGVTDAAVGAPASTPTADPSASRRTSGDPIGEESTAPAVPSATGSAATAPSATAPSAAAPTSDGPSTPGSAVSDSTPPTSGGEAVIPVSDPAVDDLPETTADGSAAVAPVSTQQLKDSWPQVLDAVQNAKRSAWSVVFTAQVRSLAGDVLTLTFPSGRDVEQFRSPEPGERGVSEYLRDAIAGVLGIRVKFIARADAEAVAPAASSPAAQVPAASAPAAPVRPDRAGRSTSPAATTHGASSDDAPSDDDGGWPTVAVPGASASLTTPPPPPAERRPTARRGSEGPESGGAARSGRSTATAVDADPSAAGDGVSAGAAEPGAAAPGAADSGSSTDADGWAVVSEADAEAAGALVGASSARSTDHGAAADADADAAAAAAAGSDPAGSDPAAVDPAAVDPAAVDPIAADSAPLDTASVLVATGPDDEIPFDDEPPGYDDVPPDDGPPEVLVGAAPASASRASGEAAVPVNRRAPATADASGVVRPATVSFGDTQRYGEAVVREVLGARFIEETPATRERGR